MTNKKKRAYLFIPISILITWFIEFKHLDFFGLDSILSFLAQSLFGFLFFLFFWLGLCYTTNKLLNYFGYEE